MRCKYCGAKLEDAASFCGDCGNKVGPKQEISLCRECGAKLPDGSKFCPNCGAAVNKLDKVVVEQVKEETGMFNGEVNLEGNTNSEKFLNNQNQVKTGTSSITEKLSLGENVKKFLLDKWNRMDLFCKVCVIILAIVGFILLIALMCDKTLTIVLTILQIGGIVAAILIHKDKLKVNKTWYKYIILIVVITFILVDFRCFSISKTNMLNDSLEIDTTVEVTDTIAEVNDTNTEVNDTNTEVNNSTEIEIFIPLGYAECIGNDFLYIESLFIDAGFTDITFEKIEDLAIDEADKVGAVESISLDGDTSFELEQAVKDDTKVVICYHCYKKCAVNVHINYISEFISDKIKVQVYFDENKEGTLLYGEYTDYDFLIEPGKHTLEIVSNDSSSVKGVTEIDVAGDINVSYDIFCYNDQISIEIEYIENFSDLGENEIMMPVEASEYIDDYYKDVMTLFEDLGFSKINTAILYDIESGSTNKGTTSSVSIKGNAFFKRGNIFSKDDPVVITYHMMKKDNPKNKEQTTESVQSSENNYNQKQDNTKANLDTKATFYSTNNYDVAKNGNSGVFAYSKRGESYDIYYIIDFDEGYVLDCQHFSRQFS